MDKVKGHVLVVDDEKVNCNVLVSLLDDYKVIVAKNGEQALERAYANPPDIILLDVVMPGMNGYEVCEKLKQDKRTASVPVIFVTVKATIDEEAQGLKMGAVDYISKPFSPAIVQARVANHIQLKQQRDLLESLNITDCLTGISNRRHFDQSLSNNWQASCRTDSLISLLMIDIDHFKEYNDSNGHHAGDACLTKVAKALDGQKERELDQVCRYGGEEFAVILPYTDLDGAKLIAERMLSAVRKLEIPHTGSSAAEIVTISIGAACTQAGKDHTLEQLIKQADEALYRAKSAGRNRLHSTSY